MYSASLYDSREAAGEIETQTFNDRSGRFMMTQTDVWLHQHLQSRRISEILSK